MRGLQLVTLQTEKDNDKYSFCDQAEEIIKIIAWPVSLATKKK